MRTMKVFNGEWDETVERRRRKEKKKEEEEYIYIYICIICIFLDFPEEKKLGEDLLK